MSDITEFRGKHRWLSNFAPVRVRLDGAQYPSTEHAYQAAKSLSSEDREAILRCAEPGHAKRFARRFKLREDWDQVKDAIMLDLTRQKYQHSHYRELLLATSDVQIVEGNRWGDNYWGVCRGNGENRLGKIIMQVRDELRL